MKSKLKIIIILIAIAATIFTTAIYVRYFVPEKFFYYTSDNNVTRGTALYDQYGLYNLYIDYDINPQNELVINNVGYEYSLDSKYKLCHVEIDEINYLENTIRKVQIKGTCHVKFLWFELSSHELLASLNINYLPSD